MIEGDAFGPGRLGSDGDQDEVRLYRLDRAVGARHLDDVGVDESRGAGQGGHSVGHQVFMDELALVANDLLVIAPQALHRLRTEGDHRIAHFRGDGRRTDQAPDHLAEGLRGYGPGVDGDTAHAVAGLHHADTLAELRGLDGRLLAARAAADHAEIDALHGIGSTAAGESGGAGGVVRSVPTLADPAPGPPLGSGVVAAVLPIGSDSQPSSGSCQPPPRER